MTIVSSRDVSDNGGAVGGRQIARRPAPASFSKYVAVSLLQKAIRRNELRHALQATSNLLNEDPARFWRRCSIIAAEEIGIVDLGIVLEIITGRDEAKRARCHKREWAIASSLVIRMCGSRKCRASDDLAVVAQFDPGYETQRCVMAETPSCDLVRIALSDRPIVERAVALWTALGTPWTTATGLTQASRRRDQNAVFSWLREEGTIGPSMDVIERGFRQTGEIIFPLLMLLASDERTASLAKVVDDELPAMTEVGGCPSWALDGFTREGRRSISAFSKSDGKTAIWVRANIPAAERTDFIAGLLFRVESGLVRKRCLWAGADALRYRADRYSHGLRCPDASALLTMLNHDLRLLNEARAGVWELSHAR